MRLNGLFHLRSTQVLSRLVLIVLLSAVSVSAATANVTAAASHGLILSALGNACGVGENEYGELGDGTNNVDRTTPVPVATLVGALNQISTGYYHSVALKGDGTVWTWGYNGYGELGSGNTTNRPTPFSVAGLTNVVGVAAGNYHTLAVKSDGTVWAWGNNSYGQLGDGTTNSRTIPVQVVQLTNVIAVAAGQDSFSLALKSDGTVWGWGYNGYGDAWRWDEPTNRNQPRGAVWPNLFPESRKLLHAGTTVWPGRATALCGPGATAATASSAMAPQGRSPVLRALVPLRPRFRSLRAITTVWRCRATVRCGLGVTTATGNLATGQPRAKTPRCRSEPMSPVFPVSPRSPREAGSVSPSRRMERRGPGGITRMASSGMGIQLGLSSLGSPEYVPVASSSQ